MARKVSNKHHKRIQAKRKPLQAPCKKIQVAHKVVVVNKRTTCLFDVWQRRITTLFNAYVVST
jgi:hypothetical protein